MLGRLVTRFAALLTFRRRADSLAGLAAASAGLPLVARHNCQLQARRYLGKSLGSGDARTPKG